MTEKVYNFITDSHQYSTTTLVNESKSLTQYDDLTTHPREDELVMNKTSTASENIYNMEKKIDKCLKEIKCLKEDNRCLKRKLIQCNEEHSNIHTKLLTEIITIKRLITDQTTGIVERKTALPRTPFGQKEDLIIFEETIRNDAEILKVIENEVYVIGIPDPGKLVRHIWKRLVTDELACEISWIDVEGKISLQNMAITSAFKEAFSRKFGNEVEFKKITIKWFQTARDRVKYRNKKTQRQDSN